MYELHAEHPGVTRRRDPRSGDLPRTAGFQRIRESKRLRFRDHAWLFWMPLLFLPNFGFAIPTPLGVLKMSDFMIGPYVVLVLVAYRGLRGPAHGAVAIRPMLLAFLGWATLSVAVMELRYAYPSNGPLLFSLAKLMKLGLYGFAAYQTARLVREPRQRELFHWSLLASMIVVSLSLLVMQDEVERWVKSEDMRTGYSATNEISVMLAVMICYVAGLLVTRRERKVWMKRAGIVLAVTVLGFSVSRGRGGWVAAACGVAYLCYAIGLKRSTLAVLTGGGVVIVAAYHLLPQFADQVDMTLWPDLAYRRHLASYGMGVAGIDDGGRLTGWMHEAAKIFNAPVVGTGFAHRGGQTGLWITGSHNFWVQMFLETGAVGGVLALGTVVVMWRNAGGRGDRSDTLGGLPAKAAILAGFVGGLSESYFYGGMPLFVLLILGLIVGLPRSRVSTAF